MCHCGDHYCDMTPEVRYLANKEHSRLLRDPNWVRRYRNEDEREIAVASHIRQSVIEDFGPTVANFHWKVP